MADSETCYRVGDEFPVEDIAGKQNLGSLLLSLPNRKEKRKLDYHGFLLAGQVFGLAYVFNSYGWPSNLWTDSCLATYALILIAVWFSRKGRFTRLKHAGTILFLLSLACPMVSHWIQDVRGGREGTILSPWQFQFGREGKNTALLESYLGPIKPDWRHRASRSNWISWKDGNERVNSKSLIYSETLPKILHRLPTSAARRQVLRCLSDSSNLMRVHQGLLLAALDLHGYPEGYQSMIWWKAHRWIFVVEKSGLRAAYMTEHWTERCKTYLIEDENGGYANRYGLLVQQARAAGYQDTGGWGGDPGFVDGVFQLSRLMYEDIEIDRSTLTQLDEEFAGKTVVWWP
ncbi:MAG: hypothetical protein P1V97_25895 [Planctomycetota bacterium]|nr:hypothetical protein [Planctomycetota bacterium]